MHGLGFSSMIMPKLYFRCPLYGGTGKVYTVDLSKQGYKIFCQPVSRKLKPVSRKLKPVSRKLKPGSGKLKPGSGNSNP